MTLDRWVDLGLNPPAAPTSIGLRVSVRLMVAPISSKAPARNTLTPANAKQWEAAKAAFKRDGNLDAVLSRVDISAEHQEQIRAECEQVDA